MTDVAYFVKTQNIKKNMAASGLVIVDVVKHGIPWHTTSMPRMSYDDTLGSTISWLKRARYVT